MKWGLIDDKGKTVGELTAFPPVTIPAQHRVSLTNTISHAGAWPEKFFVSHDIGINAHAEARFVPATPRGRWEIYAYGANDVWVNQAVKSLMDLIKEA